MPNNWERDVNRRRELLNDYLEHLRDILKAANAGEIMAGAVVHLTQIRDFEKTN